MSAGQPLRHISESIIDGAQAEWEQVTRGAGGGLAWPALLRKLDRADPSYRN